MTKNIDIINAAVALIIKAAILAARFSGRTRKRSLKRLAAMDLDSKDAELCKEFETWYNSWRPHMTLDGIRSDDVYYNNKPDKPKCDAKTVPCNIEQHFFREIRIMGYRLKKAA